MSIILLFASALASASAASSSEQRRRRQQRRQRRTLGVISKPTIIISLSCCCLLLLLNNIQVVRVQAFQLDTRVRVHSKQSVSVPSNNATIISQNYNDYDNDNENDDKTSLTQYMRLPVEQYSLVDMPLNSTLSRIDTIPSTNNGENINDNDTNIYSRSDNNDNNTQSQSRSRSQSEQLLLFELVVPPVRFLWLEVQPIVYAVVTQQDDKVIISSDQCILEGSPFISKVHLNERFDFCVTAELMWNDTTTTNNVPASSSLEVAAAVDSSTIFAIADIEINVDVPRPFNAIPKRVIIPTGETAMQVTLDYLLGSFLQGLAEDYQLWANDSKYRQQRRCGGSGKKEEETIPLSHY